MLVGKRARKLTGKNIFLMTAKLQRAEQKSEILIKPNIFALPNQTSILFGLVVLALLGALVIGSIGRSPVLIWPLTLSLFLLTLRAFLSAPERHMKRNGLKPASTEFDDLMQTITKLASTSPLVLSLVPKLLVHDQTIGIFTFGTLRHWYIAINRSDAQRLQNDLQNPVLSKVAEDVLIHEFYHFKTGDFWQMSYGEELLRWTLILTGWFIVFLLGFGFLLIIAGKDILESNPSAILAQIVGLPPETNDTLLKLFPSSSEMEALRREAAGINLGLAVNFVMSAFLPFVLISGVLWFFYWPKFWRLRELYADAGVVHTRGEALSIVPNIMAIPLAYLRADTLQRIAQTKSTESIISKWWYRVRHPRKYHYSPLMRLKCIAEPKLVFGSWVDTAVLLGTLTLLLDILLVSPLTLLWVGQWPMHFTTIVIFVTVSLNLIPVLVQGQSGWSYMIKSVTLIVGLRFIWLLISLALLFSLFFFFPAFLSDILASGVASTAHFAGYSTDLAFDDLSEFVFRASILNLAQVFIVFMTLLLSLTVMITILQRMLTWYSFPQAKHRLIKVAYWSIAIATFGLGFTVLPLSTVLLLGTEILHQPVVLILASAGVLVMTGSLMLFLKTHRQYSSRCLQCGTAISGSYTLGKSCPACDEVLNPWLIAEYKL